MGQKSGDVGKLLAPAGSVLHTGAGTLAAGDYIGMTFLAATVISAMTGRISGAAIAGFTFPAGFTWNVPFSTLTTSSGTLIAYRDS